ncbi:hypothetical protein F4813DRAFT_372587 [Daldinia decipiens]|uniref:uncharacterized protein n=1 Tax=Daldinia decipiens TaxID=326647 RepID=UPI0020C20FF4|nr:uncharacterized protein F4813DRAFT_372587 [Daldinia decipiens]KAI1653948.1 hypothetical protein F4813DRAFT_372587 [Daldinia decipiens]
MFTLLKKQSLFKLLNPIILLNNHTPYILLRATIIKRGSSRKIDIMFKATNSHQLMIVIFPVVAVLVATICVVLRFRARQLQQLKLMWDDWLCLASLILTWAFQGVNLAAVFAGGAGLPIATVISTNPNALATFLKIVLANFSLWIVTVTIVQLSILSFYVRIFGVNAAFRRICYVFIALIAAFGIAGFFSEVFSCLPVSKTWNPSEPGHCVSSKPYCTSIGLIHCLFDLAILVLPLPLIWNLQVATRSKFVISILLTLGLIATIISLLKISCLIDLSGIPPEDVTGNLWLTILLQTLELPIGIVCCCVPILKPAVAGVSPLFRSIASRLLTYTQRSRSTTNRSQRSDSGSKYRQDSTVGFSRLEDESSQVELGSLGSLGNKLSIQAEGHKITPTLGADPKSERAINVTNSYTVSKQ